MVRFIWERRIAEATFIFSSRYQGEPAIFQLSRGEHFSSQTLLGLVVSFAAIDSFVGLAKGTDGILQGPYQLKSKAGLLFPRLSAQRTPETNPGQNPVPGFNISITHRYYLSPLNRNSKKSRPAKPACRAAFLNILKFL